MDGISEQITELNMRRAFLINGGNGYSEIGRSVKYMEEWEVQEAMEELDKDIQTLIDIRNGLYGK